MQGHAAFEHLLGAGLLGPARVRELADRLGVSPTKQWGQNFVIDPNTIRRIVSLAELDGTEHVLEVGPGLGSLTLGLLDAAEHVVAVEIDPPLAAQLPHTVARFRPEAADRLEVVLEDALQVASLPREPEALVANLPYNVAVPVLLNLLARFGSGTAAIAALPDLAHRVGRKALRGVVADCYRLFEDPNETARDVAPRPTMTHEAPQPRLFSISIVDRES